MLQSLVSQALDSGMDIQDGVENPKWEQVLDETTNEARERGAPSAPSYWIPDSRLPKGGRIIFGAERLHFVEGAVKSLEEPTTAIVPCPLPRIRHGPLKTQRKLTLFFDFSSPWNYLGWTQLGRIVEEMGPDLDLELVPTLLGIVFKEIGTPIEPRKAITSWQASEWNDTDMANWVEYWSHFPMADGNEYPVKLMWVEGPLKGKTHFPIRTPLPLRVACLKTEWNLIDAIYKAAWAKDLDISNPTVLSSVLTSAGYDPFLVEAADTPAARDALKNNTTRAVEAGVCGFPTFQVDGKELFWGQDKIDVVCDTLLGWDPEPVKPEFGRQADWGGMGW